MSFFTNLKQKYNMNISYNFPICLSFDLILKVPKLYPLLLSDLLVVVNQTRSLISLISFVRGRITGFKKKGTYGAVVALYIFGFIQLREDVFRKDLRERRKRGDFNQK
jgi:hypothetical protein